MNQKCANNIVQGAKHPFSLAVLGGRVWTRSAQQYATASQEGSGGVVDELGAIICLKTVYRTTELCVSISNKLDKVIMYFRLLTKRVRPTVMSIIINQHKIKFKTRNTQDRRGPHITMNEFKRC
jgi:hypothetical protein